MSRFQNGMTFFSSLLKIRIASWGGVHYYWVEKVVNYFGHHCNNWYKKVGTTVNTCWHSWIPPYSFINYAVKVFRNYSDKISASYFWVERVVNYFGHHCSKWYKQVGTAVIHCCHGWIPPYSCVNYAVKVFRNFSDKISASWTGGQLFWSPL